MFELSRIGFGGLTISGVWGETDDTVSINAIHQAIEEGISWIDTSPVYGLGHSEWVIGEALKNRGGKMKVATKCGLYLDKDRKSHKNLKPEFIFQDVERSLQRLKIPVIDLYQCHWPDPTTPVEETWEAMSELVKQGKVLQIGVCNYNIDLLERINKIHPVYSLQIPYNIIRREHELDLIPYCRKNNIRVLAYSPLHLGLLSGKYNPHSLAPTDRRLNAKEFDSSEKIDAYLVFIEKMKVIAQSNGISVAQLAIAWILNNASIASVITGIRTSLQATENTKASEIKLTKEELTVLDFS